MNTSTELSPSEYAIVLNCLKLVVQHGLYEIVSIDIFNAIAKKYGIDVSYTEIAGLKWEE